MEITLHLPLWYAMLCKLLPTYFLAYLAQLPTFSINARNPAIAFSSNSDSFALSIFRMMVYSVSWRIRNIPSFAPVWYPTTLALSSDGSQVASGKTDGTIQLWDPSLALKNWSDFSDTMRRHPWLLGWSPDGNRFVIYGDIIGAKLISPCAEVIKTLRKGALRQPQCQFSENSCVFAYWFKTIPIHTPKALFTTDVILPLLHWDAGQCALRVYKSLTGDRLFQVIVPIIHIADLSPDGSLICCVHGARLKGRPRDRANILGWWESVLEVWDVSSGKSLFKSPHELVSSICFLPDNSKIACGMPDGKIQLWDSRTGNYLAAIEHGTDAICDLAFSPDSNRLAYGYADGSLHFCYPLRKGLHHTLIPGSKNSLDPDSMELVLFSPDGTTINYRTSDGTFYAVKVPSELLETSNTSDNEAIPSSSPRSVQCDICKPAADQSPSSANNPAGSIASYSHVKFTSDKTNMRDCMLRSGYEIRFDGWVYDSDQRILWLPPHLRPWSHSMFSAYNDKLTMGTKVGGMLFIDLGKG
ncbi:hypothetical protein BJ138DRAFT_69976 [Hygrophoropsis aurantiaca]|uniref:Uncharacterized protein n=1 Tax=Hygrophoropsis aurantiaca TaxID=72124 RepID=A0ACB8ABK0_9AGAM|nr:hypothetical protein BJ138DRAFT_69976 [Hygrophoropsis aurantiaca]